VAKPFTTLRQVGTDTVHARAFQAAGNQVAPGHHGLPMVPGEGDYAPGDLVDPPVQCAMTCAPRWAACDE